MIEIFQFLTGCLFWFSLFLIMVCISFCVMILFIAFWIKVVDEWEKLQARAIRRKEQNEKV